MNENVKLFVEFVMRGKRAPYGLVIIGGKGSGKSTAVRLIETALPGKIVTTVNVDPKQNFSDFKRAAVTSDIVVGDDVFSMEQLDLVKQVTTVDMIEIDHKGLGHAFEKVTANVILTANFFPVTERRFVMASPLEVINSMIPYLAR